ncbi:MAG: YdcF family protein, partial [Acidimicrobiales bacterium]
ASANYLMVRGVPESAILREVDGRNTWQSLASAANELRIRDVTEVVLVSDPFHNARVEGIAEELGLTAHVSPTRTSPISGRSQFGYLLKETAAVGAGRVIGFRRLMGIDSVADRVRQEVDNR